MAWPNPPFPFANLVAGNQPLSLFDAMFNQVAVMVDIPCTATGANAITLAPIGNAPVLTAYSQFCSFVFRAAANSTGAVTLNFNAIGALPAYRADGATQIAAGDMTANFLYAAIFASQLNGGAGGFYLTQFGVATQVQVAGGSFAGLSVQNFSSFPDTQISVSAAEIVMINPNTGAPINTQGPAFTINTGVVGVNGMDSGVLAPSNWYYVWAISNGSTTAGLLSLQSATPTMPGGYVYRKRLGSMRSDNTNGQTATVTISQASPGVVTGLTLNFNNMPVVLSTTGSLPSPLVPGTTYFNVNTSGNTFNLAATPFGAPINTTSAGSGTHTATVANARLLRTLQLGRQVQYTLVAPPASTWQLPVIASGTAGTANLVNPTLVTASIANAVPPTASKARLVAYSQFAGSAASLVLVAPNAAWGTGNSGPQGAVQVVWPMVQNRTGASEPHTGGEFDIVPESTNIAWASSGAGGAVAALGWEENL